MKKLILLVFFSAIFVDLRADAQVVIYNNDFPNDLIGTASRPDSPGNEIESADDFRLNAHAGINSATFTGLIPTGATIGEVRVEIYRVFPNDSDAARTPNVVTRTNSPADVALADRDNASFSSHLTFSTTLLNPNFMVSNSILNGINPSPNQFTGARDPLQVRKFGST